ncbi:MAG: hypothetical protein KAI66_26480, partial [Lentisphaeria bacterium]|nr:hypothetical protein [Lentisphaeria bacterium]
MCSVAFAHTISTAVEVEDEIVRAAGADLADLVKKDSLDTRGRIRKASRQILNECKGYEVQLSVIADAFLRRTPKGLAAYGDDLPGPAQSRSLAARLGSRTLAPGLVIKTKETSDAQRKPPAPPTPAVVPPLTEEQLATPNCLSNQPAFDTPVRSFEQMLHRHLQVAAATRAGTSSITLSKAGKDELAHSLLRQKFEYDSACLTAKQAGKPCPPPPVDITPLTEDEMNDKSDNGPNVGDTPDGLLVFEAPVLDVWECKLLDAATSTAPTLTGCAHCGGAHNAASCGILVGWTMQTTSLNSSQMEVTTVVETPAELRRKICLYPL